mmetsp:Transcript_3343/g.8103  ORF Transcript_3343/g.8103 Transcript_3343/m.8103 type:complete len:350 (-) Transcript_3343:723-1772(-)
MHGRCVDCDGFVCRNVRTIFQIGVLSFLLCFEPQSGKTTEVFLAYCLVDGGTTANAFPVVVRSIGPPISLRLDIAQYHVLHRSRKTRDLPWNIRLPAAPRFGQVLQDGPGFVGLHTLWHHINDVMHYCGTQFQIEMTFDALLGQRFRNPLRHASLELPSEQISQPTFQQRHHSAQEEQPHPPSRGPKTAPGSFSDGTCVEAIVNQMLQILAHPNLTHQPILVPVHPRQLSDVCEDVLKTVCKLECVYVSETILNVRIYHQLGQSQNFPTKMERVAKTGLLALLGCEGLHRLQVEIVIEVQKTQVLAMDQEIEHIVSLPADLQTNLHPIQFSDMEKLGLSELLEKVLLLE